MYINHCARHFGPQMLHAMTINIPTPIRLENNPTALAVPKFITAWPR